VILTCGVFREESHSRECIEQYGDSAQGRIELFRDPARVERSLGKQSEKIEFRRCEEHAGLGELTRKAQQLFRCRRKRHTSPLR